MMEMHPGEHQLLAVEMDRKRKKKVPAGATYCEVLWVRES